MSERNHPERLYYLGGIRLLTHVLTTPEAWLSNPELAKGEPQQQSLFPQDRWPAARRIAFEKSKAPRIPRKPVKSHLPIERMAKGAHA